MKVYTDKLPDNISISFKYGCSLELVCSLHVITDPTHHSNCTGWYDTMTGTVKNTLIERIVDFGNRYAQWNFVMDLFDILTNDVKSHSSHIDDFKHNISRVRDMRDSDFLYFFLGGVLLHDETSSKKIINSPEELWNHCNIELKKYISEENIYYFISNISTVKSEMLDIITEYYDSFFKEFWESASTYYTGAVSIQEKKMNSNITVEQILSLHGSIFYENGRLLIKKNTVFSLTTSMLEHITIIFSVFTYPHLMINICGNHLSIYENLLIPNVITSFDTITEDIRTLGDSTRITMIRMLQKYTLTNKELSRLLYITPATVSQHLKVLKSSGFLISNRQKNTIYYHLNNVVFSKSLKRIMDYFEIED